MSATDELHRMLTEAGIEYRFNNATKVFEWHFDGTDGEGSAHATEVNGGINIIACSLTPEQAIAATVWRGTCKPREVRSRFSKTQEHVTYYCECGHELGGYMTAEFPFPHTYNEDKLPNYCPNCGARIEVDG